MTVEGLGVRFGGLRAVQGVAMTLTPGEVVAVIGPNGAGKTTFVNALSGIAGGATVEGSINFAGKELRKVRPTRRRSRGLGRTFQHAELFPELSVAENVLVVNRWATTADRRRVHRLLASVGLAGLGHRRPADLSFGPQKRIDLARAIAESPRLLILDEPFGGLDAEERSVLAVAHQAAADGRRLRGHHRPRPRRPLRRRGPGGRLRLRPAHRRGDTRDDPG